MADTKITALAAIATVDPAADVLPIVDISDTSMAASGTTKKVTSNQILGAGGTATLASATITGDLTVDTNVLKVDSTLNRVGILTATPAQSLDIASGNLQVRTGGTVFSDTFSNYGAALAINAAGSLPIRLQIAGTNAYEITSANVHTWSNVGGTSGTAMTLNSTGLGVGVVPYVSWPATSKALQLGASSAIEGRTNDGSRTSLYTNAVWNGTNLIYQNTAAASYYLQSSSVHSWYTAPSGTAGNNITFTQAMTLDASGNLLVGTTAPLQISNNPAVTSRISNLGTGSKGAMILRENEASAFWGGNVFLQKVRGTSTAVQSGDILGTVAFGGFDGTNYVNTAVIQTSVTGAVSAGVVPVKIQVVATSGGVELTNTATSWAAISDERLKDIIEPINNAVSKVGLLRSVIGKYKSDSEGTRRSFLIAQDVQSALPEAVGGNEDSMTVRYTEVIPLLVAAIKELTARVQTLEAK